jgi:hypothetical protein
LIGTACHIKYSVESGGILKYLHPEGLIAAIKAITILKTGRLQLPEVHRAKRLRAGDQTPHREITANRNATIAVKEWFYGIYGEDDHGRGRSGDAVCAG